MAFARATRGTTSSHTKGQVEVCTILGADKFVYSLGFHYFDNVEGRMHLTFHYFDNVEGKMHLGNANFWSAGFRPSAYQPFM